MSQRPRCPKAFDDGQSLEARVVDAVRPVDGDGNAYAVVLHEQPRVVDLGYGALDVPYYLEIQTPDLQTTLSRYTFDAPVSALAISPDAGMLAVGDAKGTVHLIDRGSGVVTSWSEASMPIRFLEFLEDDGTLAISIAPARTAGGLLGTGRVRFQVWSTRRLLRIACDLLPLASDRDFSAFRAAVNAVASKAGAAVADCEGVR